MHVILLSGGSGKRLWPLSNDVRSKQFIKLFKDEKGGYESMLQRVYRQISHTINAKITVATGKAQVSAICNQLNGRVSVSVEPCRRDTFPAIALCAAYLKDELGVDENECVAVCPVDPYVDDSYYRTVGELEKIIAEMKDGVALMGIEPDSPSEKFGYILPETKERISKVSCFKEKPQRQTAGEYIAQGALWNAGVFAFRLGYMLEKAHELVDFRNYRDLYANYAAAPKISFDYAVLEKEKNVRVVRYGGAWKDVGTWNALAEVMADEAKGNVISDDACKNTQVINELSIPVVCMGCENLIIAVGEDGILVSEKNRSEFIKPYVEKLTADTRIAEKSWGEYRVLDERTGAKVIRLNIKAGASTSYHAHEYRKEIWTVISGEGTVTLDGTERNVSAGDVVEIAVKSKHALRAATDMEIVETQTGEKIDRADKRKYSL